MTQSATYSYLSVHFSQVETLLMLTSLLNLLQFHGTCFSHVDSETCGASITLDFIIEKPDSQPESHCVVSRWVTLSKCQTQWLGSDGNVDHSVCVNNLFETAPRCLCSILSNSSEARTIPLSVWLSWGETQFDIMWIKCLLVEPAATSDSGSRSYIW